MAFRMARWWGAETVKRELHHLRVPPTDTLSFFNDIRLTFLLPPPDPGLLSSGATQLPSPRMLSIHISPILFKSNFSSRPWTVFNPFNGSCSQIQSYHNGLQNTHTPGNPATCCFTVSCRCHDTSWCQTLHSLPTAPQREGKARCLSGWY